jgi:hypothetical protein
MPKVRSNLAGESCSSMMSGALMRVAEAVNSMAGRESLPGTPGEEMVLFVHWFLAFILVQLWDLSGSCTMAPNFRLSFYMAWSRLKIMQPDMDICGMH